jgi:hypothetical protein
MSTPPLSIILEITSAIANWITTTANVTLFIIGFKTLQNDRRRIVQMEQADRQKYAEHVFAWIEERTSSSTNVFCRNGGTSVIYKLRIALVDQANRLSSGEYEIELMKPGEERNFTIQNDSGITSAGVQISFRDSGGISWHRESNGILHEVTEQPLMIDSNRRVLIK